MGIFSFWDKGIKFSLVYPNNFLIIDRDRTCFFNTPEAALKWLDTH